MSDLRGFSQRIRNIAGQINTNSDRVTRQCALAVDGSVVIATPVDTGRARANWIVNIDGPSTTIVQEPASPAQGARQALDQGRATIATYQKGQAIHITNNLPYIGRLNDGYSAQAPENFVLEAVNAGIQTLRNARLIE